MNFYSPAEGLHVVRFQIDSPSAEGLLHQMPFVAWGDEILTMRVGQNPIETPLYEAQLKSFQWRSEADVLDTLAKLAAKLGRAPFLFHFLGTRVRLIGALPEVQILPTEEPELFSVWAPTAAQAYKKLAQPSSVLVNAGFSSELQQRIFTLQKISMEPIEHDLRIFDDETFLTSKNG